MVQEGLRDGTRNPRAALARRRHHRLAHLREAAARSRRRGSVAAAPVEQSIAAAQTLTPAVRNVASDAIPLLLLGQRMYLPRRYSFSCQRAGTAVYGLG